MIYRIYTEDKNRETIEQIVGAHMDGYTLIPCSGVWKGSHERSLIIEIVTDRLDAPTVVKAIAQEIKTANEQEAVMIAALINELQFV